MNETSWLFFIIGLICFMIGIVYDYFAITEYGITVDGIFAISITSIAYFTLAYVFLSIAYDLKKKK